MTTNMSDIDCNKVLPQELAIKSIEDILYSIGLSQHSVKDQAKRSPINNPKFITTFVFVLTIMKVLSLLTDEEMTLLLLTEYSHYLGIKIYININIIFLSLIVIFTETTYFLNDWRGVKPTLIRVLQVMSGSVRPSSVGLTDKTKVKQLVKLSKWLPMIKKNNETIIPLLNALFVLCYYLLSMDLDRALLFAIYPVIINTLLVYYIFSIINIKIFLFFILCKYFVLKIRAQNQILKTLKIITPKKIIRILHSYDGIYREIQEYNSSYWSQFLFTIWLFFGVTVVNIIFLVLFAPIALTIKIISIYFGTLGHLLPDNNDNRFVSQLRSI